MLATDPHGRAAGGNDWAGLLAGIDPLADPELRNEALERAVSSVPSSKLQEALAALAGAEGGTAAEFRELLLRRWAEGNPKTAADWIEQFRGLSVCGDYLVQVAVAWADTDYVAAWAWANSLPEGESKQKALMAAAYEESRFDPKTVLAATSTLPSSADRDRLLAYAVSQWTSSDPAAAKLWVEKLSNPTLRQMLGASAVVALADSDGAGAANLAAEFLDSGPEQDRVAVAVVQRWAQNVPLSAAQWIIQFPDTPVREEALQALATVWTAHDNDGMSSWLNSLPNGPLRSAAAEAQSQALRATGLAMTSLAR